MEIGDQRNRCRGLGLNDGRDEDGEGDGEHADGLVFDSLHLIGGDLSIPQIGNDGCETK